MPIDYWSKSLIRKYHNDSLNIRNRKTSLNEKHVTKQNKLDSNEIGFSQIFSKHKQDKVIFEIFK